MATLSSDDLSALIRACVNEDARLAHKYTAIMGEYEKAASSCTDGPPLPIAGMQVMREREKLNRALRHFIQLGGAQ